MYSVHYKKRHLVFEACQIKSSKCSNDSEYPIEFSY